MLYLTDIVPKEKQGKGAAHCLVCCYGMQEEVDKLALKGHTKKCILSVLKAKITKYHPELKDHFIPALFDIRHHLTACSGGLYSDRLVARRARRALKKQKKSIEEINEMVMDHIAMALELPKSITKEELEKLTPKEKLEFASDATKLLQSEKRLALDAQKAGIEKARFLSEQSRLASGGVLIDQSEEEPTLLLEGTENG